MGGEEIRVRLPRFHGAEASLPRGEALTSTEYSSLQYQHLTFSVVD